MFDVYSDLIFFLLSLLQDWLNYSRDFLLSEHFAAELNTIWKFLIVLLFVPLLLLIL